MLGPLHEQRLAAVLAVLLASELDSVMDLGCGSGTLLTQLLRQPRFSRILGIDASSVALEVARRELLGRRADTEGRLKLVHGSYTEPEPALRGYRAATLVETIEHLDPGRLSRLEHTVFAGYAPELVLVTTPNAEYNPIYGLRPGQLRDPDHCFEWNRGKFRDWAAGVARRNGYRMHIRGIGEADPELGAPSQMAVFEANRAGSVSQCREAVHRLG